MPYQVHAFARRALWALALWAVLLFLSTLTHQPDPQTDFAGFGAYVTTTQFLLSHLVGSIAVSTVGFALSNFLFPPGQSLFSALLVAATAAVAWSAGREEPSQADKAVVSPGS